MATAAAASAAAANNEGAGVAMFRKDGAGRQADDRRDALASGARAEDQALAHLLSKGLRLVERNYRVARGPSKRGGEIDLIMPLDEGALFDGLPAGWMVTPAGSAHCPTVSGGRALVLYLLPQGRIEFTARA